MLDILEFIHLLIFEMMTAVSRVGFVMLGVVRRKVASSAASSQVIFISCFDYVLKLYLHDCLCSKNCNNNLCCWSKPDPKEIISYKSDYAWCLHCCRRRGNWPFLFGIGIFFWKVLLLVQFVNWYVDLLVCEKFWSCLLTLMDLGDN